MATGPIKMDESNKKTTFSLDLPNGYTMSVNHSYRLGNLVFIGGVIELPQATTAKRVQLSSVIPSAYASLYRIDFAANNNGSDSAMHCILNGRTIDFYRPDTESMTQIAFSVVYPLI